MEPSCYKLVGTKRVKKTAKEAVGIPGSKSSGSAKKPHMRQEVPVEANRMCLREGGGAQDEDECCMERR